MLDFTRFEILTFDCYGTLIDWEEGILASLHSVLAAHEKNIADTEILKLYAEFEAQAEMGEYRPYREVLNTVVQRFGEEFHFVPSAREINSLADSLGRWQPWPDTVTALHALRKQFRLAIISNVDDDLFAATLTQLQVDFSQIITAQQARAYKPSLKIFELALSRLHVPAHRILHVGQSLYHDVLPAQSLGLSTVWVNRPSRRSGVGAVRQAEASPDLQVHSLAELASLSAQQ